MMADGHADGEKKRPRFGLPDDPRAWVAAANEIAERIADGTLKPGERIVMTDILSDLGIDVSRPAYYALRELARAGLVEKRNRERGSAGQGHFVAGEPPGPPAPGVPVPGTPAPAARNGPGRAPLTLGEETDNYLTVPEVAVRLRVSKMTVYRLAKDGDLAYLMIGRSYRIPEQGLHEYLRKSARR